VLFRRMPQFRNPLVEALRDLAREIRKLKEIVMTTKDEALAALNDVKTLAGELVKDVRRLADKFDAAAAAQDFTAVTDAAAELRQVLQGADDRIEQSDPEQAAPVEPEQPVEG
jgi:hypothetical protein